MSSTHTLVTLLRPWIRRFTIIISAWWLRTNSKFTWEEVKTSTGNLGKWSTPKRVRICPKYSAPSLSRDRRIKMHQSINQSINQSRQSEVFTPSGRHVDTGQVAAWHVDTGQVAAWHVDTGQVAAWHVSTGQVAAWLGRLAELIDSKKF